MYEKTEPLYSELTCIHSLEVLDFILIPTFLQLKV